MNCGFDNRDDANIYFDCLFPVVTIVEVVVVVVVAVVVVSMMLIPEMVTATLTMILMD